MKKYIYFLILIPFFLSCEKDANIDIPVSKPQLVAACFIGANEDTVRLKLNWSSPIYYTAQTNLENEEGATVVISKGTQQYPMIWNQTTESYIATNTNFNKGDVIDLSITFKTENIEASCTIAPEPQYKMEYKGVTKVIENGWENLSLNYTFTNNSSSETSYYRILFEGYYTDNYSHQTYSYQLWNKYGELFSLANGEATDIEVSFNFYGDQAQIDSLRYYVIRCDYDYYKYHKSIYHYEGENFFTEPSIIYSNMKSGLGILASYNMVSDTTLNLK